MMNKELKIIYQRGFIPLEIEKNRSKTTEVAPLAGFTLIEMLVVIAIVGILSSTVLTALGPSRQKAKDSRIIQELNQVRALAATLDDGDFDALQNLPSPVVNDENLRALVDSVAAQGGEVVIKKIGKPAESYIAYSKLNTLVGEEPNFQTQYYCIDSNGNSEIFTDEPLNKKSCR